jgi:biotin transport system substrate-specific component
MDACIARGVFERSASELRRAALLRVAGVIGFALATAVSARIAIPLPHTPVPITIQTLVVMLAGVSLGPVWGTLSMLFYIVLGSAGYHVFALGNWGLQTMVGATGGYLIGFALAQPVIGRLTRPGRRRMRDLIAALLAGKVIIFGCGLIWLAAWLGTDLARTLELGLWPFIPGGVLKLLAAGLVGVPVLARIRPAFDGGREHRPID